MQLIYSFTVALFLTIALIPLLIRFSAKLQLLDSPEDERKVHTQVIPRSGGLAIVIGVFLPLLFLLPIEKEFLGLILGGIVIVIFGYLDDRYELAYQWKFLGQIVAVVTVMLGGVSIAQVPLMGLEDAPLWLSLPLTFFFLLGATNAVNLSDGLDGLAAGTSLLSLALITVFALVQEKTGLALIALTLIGGLLGFLRYNTFPARIFMGDTGSQFLGYMVACLAILVTQGDSCAISPALPLLILGLPILDTLTVMAIRIKEKRSPFAPDKNHIHHQLMSLGLKHFEAVGLIYIIQVTLMVSAYVLRYESDLLLLLFYLTFSVIFIGILSLGKRKKALNSSMAAIEARDRRNQLLRKFEWYYNNSAIVIEVAVSASLIMMAVMLGDVRKDFSLTALFIVVCLVPFVFTFKKYRELTARLCAYTASVFVVYLFSTTADASNFNVVIDSLFIALVVFLMLAIKMTRREDFRLDTQDLLVLFMVIIVPQLPFESLNDHSVSLIALRLAALMYSCEFVLGRAKTKYKILTGSSVVSLFIVSLSVFI